MSVLRDCQLVQLKLLHAVDDLCKKHQLRYFLHGGTLLGAMRHNGFIPWDDDLDIGMPMEDYKKFLKIAKEELPKGVFLQTPEDNPHISIAFAKIRDGNSFYHEAGQYMQTADPSGIYIDVFAFERMPRLPFRMQQLFVRLVSSPWMRQRWFLAKGADHVILSPFCSLAAVGCWLAHGIFRLLFNMVRFILPCENYYLQLEKGDFCPFKENWFYPLGNHRFEDANFPVPKDVDSCLKASYGDWLWIPPPEKRPRHATIIDPLHAA